MTQAELNIANLCTWFLINCEDDGLITSKGDDWPEGLSTELVMYGAD